MAFSGERNSWLILDKNSDLARLAFSATPVAACSSRFFSSKASAKHLRALTSVLMLMKWLTKPCASCTGDTLNAFQNPLPSLR